jgi:NADPH:quinone reductase-like Zn-dependent oxidoreductase
MGGIVKAAVLREVGGIPRYEEFPAPVAGEGEVIVDVKAVAVKNVDKMIAAGQHYASGQHVTQWPAIPGLDGIGSLPDGTRVGFAGPRPPYGALAEQTVVAADAVAPIPAGLDPVTAVVLATAVTGMTWCRDG